MFILDMPTTNIYNDLFQNYCSVNYCISSLSHEEIARQKFIHFMNHLEIKKYKLGRFDNGYYDCSGILSRFLVDNGILKKRINSYILYMYGIQIEKGELKEGDLIVWYGDEGRNHTAYFSRFDSDGKIVIKDQFETGGPLAERKKNTVILGENQKHRYIGNPYIYGFKDSFKKHFKNFIYR